MIQTHQDLALITAHRRVWWSVARYLLVLSYGLALLMTGTALAMRRIDSLPLDDWVISFLYVGWLAPGWVTLWWLRTALTRRYTDFRIFPWSTADDDTTSHEPPHTPEGH